MDPAAAIADQVEDLEVNIDDLTAALQPLLATPLVRQTSTLPLLDKAKLYILHAYAIESLLFSSLQASGVDAKAHPIFKELARLKGYFKKVKDAELGSVPTTRIDKGAAGRFIRAGLAGNEKYDKERAERVAREKARAKLLAKRNTKKRFDSDGEEIVAEQQATEVSGAEEKSQALKKRKVDETEKSDIDSENAELYGPALSADDDTHPSDAANTPHSKRRKQGNQNPEAADAPNPRETRKAERRAEKAQRKLEKATGVSSGKPEELLVPQKDDGAPRTHSETFKALLEGPLPKRSKGRKGKEKGK